MEREREREGRTKTKRPWRAPPRCFLKIFTYSHFISFPSSGRKAFLIGPQEKEKRKLAAPLELLAKEEKWKGILRSWRFLNLVYGTTPCAGQVATLLFFHCPVRWPFIFVVVVVFVVSFRLRITKSARLLSPIVRNNGRFD